MGPEALIIPGLWLGAALTAYYLYLCCRSTSRPFALSTLIAALLFASLLAGSGGMSGFFWRDFFMVYVPGLLAFGLHALCINVLLKFSNRQTPPPETLPSRRI